MLSRGLSVSLLAESMPAGLFDTPEYYSLVKLSAKIVKREKLTVELSNSEFFVARAGLILASDQLFLKNVDVALNNSQIYQQKSLSLLTIL